MLVNTLPWECKRKKELHISSIPSGYPALKFLPTSTYKYEAALVLACFLMRSPSCSGFGSLCWFVSLLRKSQLWKKVGGWYQPLPCLLYALPEQRCWKTSRLSLVTTYLADGFFWWQTIPLSFDTRKLARERLFDLNKRRLKVWQNIFFSLCEVCNIMSGTERD